MLSVEKLLALSETKIGQLVISQVDEQALLGNLANILASTGISEKSICAILNVLEASKPEGGYKKLLLDPSFRKDITEFLRVLKGEENEPIDVIVDTPKLI